MNKIFTFLFFCIFLSVQSIAQLSPKETAKLHYRMIGFSFPAEDGAIQYKIEIAKGNYNSEDSFEKNIVRSVAGKENKLIAEVPSFDCSYTWRAVPVFKEAKVSTSVLHHFSTVGAAITDSDNVHLKITKPAIKYKDAFVFVDATRTLYDMTGAPVWYLPEKKEAHSKPLVMRDMKLSSRGTITFLLDNAACEINYNGDILWTAPDNGKVNGEDSEQYHHEFTRLSNGHYMVLGTEHVPFQHKITAVPDNILSESQAEINADSFVSVTDRTPFGTVIEYDQNGKVVWSWRSSRYFTGSDLVNYIPEIRKKIIDVHENAFFFDEKDSVIYISFKNISRILKIRYPGGEVMNTFGEIFRQGILPAGNGLFCAQHACKRSSEGYLYLFDNNVCGAANALPRVLMFRENEHGNDSLKEVWKYQCVADGGGRVSSTAKGMDNQRARFKDKIQAHDGSRMVTGVTSGGNVEELPDRSIFVSTDARSCKLFIVDRDKKIVWSAVTEKRNPKTKEWGTNARHYKASIVSREELEKLIWNNDKTGR